MKRNEKKPKSELPDHVMSYIFSKLNMKDLVKTSTLSKRWIHEWGLRMDLNFDLQNLFDYNTIPESSSLPLFIRLQSEFATRLDQFMLHYQGPKIRSFRVNFPLGDEHSDIVGRLISQGIAKGAERIELLFSYKTIVNDLILRIRPCKFSFTLLSDSDSLKYLHLENCHLVAPMEFSGLKNLRTLVLHLVDVNQDLLLGLFSNCIHLVDLTLNDCKYHSNFNIISPTLCHLNIGHHGNSLPIDIHVFASNLSSFEYSSYPRTRHNINIKAPMLSKFSYTASLMPRPFGFSGLKNVTTIVFEGLRESLDDMMPCMFSECLQLEDVTFKDCAFAYDLKIISPKLRHLNIIDCGLVPFPFPKKIEIDALNLSSFEYSGHMRVSSIKAPLLLKVFWNATKREKKSRPFDVIASLHQLQNLNMIMSHSQIAILPRVLGAFENLRQLEFFIEGTYNHDMDYFWILDIAMVSLHLQKLSLTIRNSHQVAFCRQRREHAGFLHNELKYVELHGCVANTSIIELATCFLRNVTSLKKITFSSCDRFYTGAGRWVQGFDSCGCFERNLIREMLKDEVNEQCQLIIL